MQELRTGQWIEDTAYGEGVKHSGETADEAMAWALDHGETVQSVSVAILPANGSTPSRYVRREWWMLVETNN